MSKREVAPGVADEKRAIRYVIFGVVYLFAVLGLVWWVATAMKGHG